MALVKWTPLREMRDLERQLGRAFGRPFVSLFEEPAGGLTTFGPPMDVFARDKDLVLRLELPGVPADGIEITLADHMLMITGERMEEKEVKEEDFYRRERSYGSFERSFPVPEKISENDVSASFEDGVLEVVIAGAIEEEPVRHIEVKTKGEKKELKAEGHKEHPYTPGESLGSEM